MTFSLVARDAAGQTFGVATASKYLAVGATVPAVAAGVGALVTQARTNVAFRERGLRFLRAGLSAARTVELLIEPDTERDLRQVAVVAASGRPAVWTGRRCWPEAGAVVGEECAAVGNFLADGAVLTAMVDAFGSGRGPLADRLLAGLAAGDAAGGDRRGRQSAALVVASGMGLVRLRTKDRVDLRVDDHPRPVDELARLLARHHVLVAEPDPATARRLTGATSREVRAALEALGFGEGSLPDRLRGWAERENLHHLLLDEAVDLLLLAELRAHVGSTGTTPA